MRRRSFAIITAGLAATTTIVALAQERASVESVMSALRGVNPSVSWDGRSIVSADVNCDGRIDSVAVGYQGGAIWVGLVPGGRASGSRRPVALRFPVEVNRADAFCSTPVRLEEEPRTCRTNAGPLPGCRPAPVCVGFAV